MKWKAAASYTRWNDPIIMYMWRWKWNPEKRNTLLYLTILCHWKSSQDMLTSFALAKKVMLLVREKIKGIWENVPSFSSVLWNSCTCVQEILYYFIISYCVLVPSVYFPHWTHKTIPLLSLLAVEKRDWEHLSCTRQHDAWRQGWDLNTNLCPCDQKFKRCFYFTTFLHMPKMFSLLFLLSLCLPSLLSH